MDWTGKRVLAPGFYDFFLEEIGKRPGNYMETGVFEGWGLRELALRYPARMFFGIDSFVEDGHTTGHTGVEKGGSLEKERTVALSNLCSLCNVDLIELSSDKVELGDVAKLGITFFFVDGKHDYNTALSDLRLALKVLVFGGVIGIDDLGVEDVADARRDFLWRLNERLHYVSDRHINSPGDLIYLNPL